MNGPFECRVLFAAVLLLGSAQTWAQPSYTLRDLETLGGTSAATLAVGTPINNAGEVIGTSSVVIGNAQYDHGFVYRGSAMIDIDAPPADTRSTPYAINSAGDVAGIFFPSGSATLHAFLYRANTLTDIGTLGGTGQVLAYGINDAGQVAGLSNGSAFIFSNGVMSPLGPAVTAIVGINASGQVFGTHVSTNGGRHAVRFSNGVTTDLGTLGGTGSESFAVAMNNNGEVAGQASAADGSEHAFVYTNGSMIDLGRIGPYRGAGTEPTAINASGQVVGSSFLVGDLVYHAFRSEGNGIVDLGSLGGASSSSLAWAINASGQIVGQSYTPGNAAVHAVVWLSGALYDLNSLVDAGDALRPFITLTLASAINDAGQIVARGTDSRPPFTTRVFRLDPVTSGGATPPQITSSIGGTSVNGWYTTDVSLTWIVTDATSTTGCDPTSITSDTTSSTFTCTATGSGGTSQKSETIKRDTAAPVVSAAPLTMANSNGWYHTPVTVRVTGIDATSGIASCTADQTLSSEGAGASVFGDCVDNAGNVSAMVTVSGIKIDLTAPTVSITTPNGGTYTQGAVINASYGCGDALSGIAQCAGSVASGAPIDTATPGARTFSVSATDLAGNMAVASAPYTVTPASVVDSTPPVIQPRCNGAACSSNWYGGDVALTWTVIDAQSAVTSTSGCAPAVIRVNTSATGRSFTCSGTSAGGTSSVTATIKRDANPPTIVLLRPRNNQTFTVNQQVTAVYACADLSSLIADCTGTVDSGARIDTASAGLKAFSVNARDNAGNVRTTTIQYLVQ